MYLPKNDRLEKVPLVALKTSCLGVPSVFHRFRCLNWFSQPIRIRNEIFCESNFADNSY